MLQAQAHALASLRSSPCIFGISHLVFSLPCQPRVQVKQHPFSTWTTFGDRFCTIYRFLLVVLATFFYIEIFSNHYFLDLSYSTPSSRPWGKPCTASSTSHSPSLVCWNQYQFNRRILGLIVSRFGCTILLLANPAKFSTSLTFSPCTFFWIFHDSPQDEDKGGSLPHQVLLLTLFFCWNVHHATSQWRIFIKLSPLQF